MYGMFYDFLIVISVVFTFLLKCRMSGRIVENELSVGILKVDCMEYDGVESKRRPKDRGIYSACQTSMRFIY